MKVVLESW